MQVNQKFVIIAALTLILTTVNARGQKLSPKWLVENYTKREVMVPMRDGVKLYTAVYEPVEGLTAKPDSAWTGAQAAPGGPHPIIMMRTPYSLGPYGKTFSDNLRVYMRTYAEQRYIIVYQNVRGTYLSEGDFENVRPVGKAEPDDATDTYDTVDWLLANTHNNGKVGVKGISYNGYYSTVAALSAHPAIAAVSPQAPIADWFVGDDAHFGGEFQMGMYTFGLSFMRKRRSPTIRRAAPLLTIDKDVYDYFYEYEDASSLFATLKDSLDFINQLRRHPAYDDFWAERNPLSQLGKARAAMLVVGGWYDAEDCYGSFETYRKAMELGPEGKVFLVAGPWSHGAWKSLDYDHLSDAWFGKGLALDFLKDMEYPFFAYYLEGKGERPAPVTILPSGETMKNKVGGTEWERTEAWPKQEARPARLYLSEGETLSFDEPESLKFSFKYVSDPRRPVPYCGETSSDWNRGSWCGDQKFATRRTDVISFLSPVLTDTLKVEGVIRAHIKVQASTTDADIIVKVVDIRPDGYQAQIRFGLMPLRFRKGFDKPEAAVPGETVSLDFAMNDLAHHFMPGHRIMVQIQSSMFPFVWMNPQKFMENPYFAGPEDYQTSEISIISGSAEEASYLDLPIIR